MVGDSEKVTWSRMSEAYWAIGGLRAGTYAEVEAVDSERSGMVAFNGIMRGRGAEAQRTDFPRPGNLFGFAARNM